MNKRESCMVSENEARGEIQKSGMGLFPHSPGRSGASAVRCTSFEAAKIHQAVR